MKNKLVLIGILASFLAFSACSNDSASSIEVEEADLIVGIWKLDPTPGSLIVGPSKDSPLWSISADEITTRNCLYNDLYIFNENGTFENDMGNETWLEEWQDGIDIEGCGSPVAPHDGSNIGTWDVNGQELTIIGEGNFLGLAKTHNDSEDGNPLNDTILYSFDVSGNTLEITIKGWYANDPNWLWYSRYAKQ